MDVVVRLQWRPSAPCADGADVLLTPAYMEELLRDRMEQSRDLGHVQIKPLPQNNVVVLKLDNEDLARKVVNTLDGSSFPLREEFVIKASLNKPRKRARPNAPRVPQLESVEPWCGFHPDISGLYAKDNVITFEEEDILLKELEKESSWEASIHRKQPKNRRVQHFGYKFDYGIRRCDTSQPAAPFPAWLTPVLKIVNSIVSDVLNNSWAADQVTVNEYLPGQGIAPHVDTHSAFEDAIVSLSLGSRSVMRFAPGGDKSQQKSVLLDRRALLIMTGASRYYYTHGIPQRKNDIIQGTVTPRETRLSFTFRKVKHTPTCDACKFPALCDLGEPECLVLK